MEKTIALDLFVIIEALKQLRDEVSSALSAPEDTEAAEAAAATVLSQATNAHSCSSTRKETALIALIVRLANGLEAKRAALVNAGGMPDAPETRGRKSEPLNPVTFVGFANGQSDDGAVRSAALVVAAGALCTALQKRVGDVTVGKSGMIIHEPSCILEALRERYPSFETSSLKEKLAAASDLFSSAVFMFESEAELNADNCLNLALAIRMVFLAREGISKRLPKKQRGSAISFATRDVGKIERSISDNLRRCMAVYSHIQILLALAYETVG